MITKVNDGVVQDTDKGMEKYCVCYRLGGVGDYPEDYTAQKCTNYFQIWVPQMIHGCDDGLDQNCKDYSCGVIPSPFDQCEEKDSPECELPCYVVKNQIGNFIQNKFLGIIACSFCKWVLFLNRRIFGRYVYHKSSDRYSDQNYQHTQFRVSELEAQTFESFQRLSKIKQDKNKLNSKKENKKIKEITDECLKIVRVFF